MEYPITHKEVKKETLFIKHTKKIFWGSRLVTIILLIILVVAVAQTVEAVVVLNKIKNGSINSAITTDNTNSSSATDLNNLPDMVGGC